MLSYANHPLAFAQYSPYMKVLSRKKADKRSQNVELFFEAFSQILSQVLKDKSKSITSLSVWMLAIIKDNSSLLKAGSYFCSFSPHFYQLW